ncbi:MAG: phytanoyl-CoA dioxygenase family protein [Gammaproteobacteria bacterium]|jgi:ectoine hydroxylase-related dioxygenase (phytanoyl-CoA dioxygenase family)|nr:phytanoyl-CoA dioxygenase family protein [Gammaproteobacteria bacterium]
MSAQPAFDVNTDAIVERIETEGYAVVEQLLPLEDVLEIKDALAPWLQGERMGRNDFEGLSSERVYALLAKAPPIAKIIENPVTLAVIDRLLPTNYLLSACLAINVHPGETPQRFHSDDSGSRFWKAPHSWCGISTIWSFDDFTGDNGATEVIPGSHLWAEEDFPPAEDQAVKVEMPAGSVVIFAGNLLHRGGANKSQGKRLGITPQYCAPWLRQLENMVLAVPPDIAGQYSDRVQSLLGYNVIDPGFMGHVDGLHPKRLIDPDYKGRKTRGVAS